MTLVQHLTKSHESLNMVGPRRAEGEILFTSCVWPSTDALN